MNTCVALAVALGTDITSIYEAVASITVGCVVIACLIIWVLK